MYLANRTPGIIQQFFPFAPRRKDRRTLNDKGNVFLISLRIHRVSVSFELLIGLETANFKSIIRSTVAVTVEKNGGKLPEDVRNSI